MLILLVKLLIPHQFAFIVGFVVHLITVSSCEHSSVRKTREFSKCRSAELLRAQHSRSTHASHYHALLLLLFWLLPAHGAVLFVWVRNLLVLIDRPHAAKHLGVSSWIRGSSGLPESTFLTGEDHDIWHVLAILIIVEACSAGKTLEISPR